MPAPATTTRKRKPHVPSDSEDDFGDVKVDFTPVLAPRNRTPTPPSEDGSETADSTDRDEEEYSFTLPSARKRQAPVQAPAQAPTAAPSQAEVAMADAELPPADEDATGDETGDETEDDEL